MVELLPALLSMHANNVPMELRNKIQQAVKESVHSRVASLKSKFPRFIRIPRNSPGSLDYSGGVDSTRK